MVSTNPINTMNNRIYLAGKITGDPNYKQKFVEGVEILKNCGFKAEDIVNPVELCQEGWSWLRCMIHDLRLMAGCSWIAFLSDWKDSRGARIERFFAQMLGKYTIYLNN